MSTPTVIIGAQWGDEGKGKVVDYLAEGADVVVRFNGGGNAGHTVQLGDRTYRFHYLPSGVLHGKLCVLGTGMVINPPELLREIEQFQEWGWEPRIRISGRAGVIFPHHQRLDALHGGRIGTTGKGIGPAYAALAARTNLRMADLTAPDWEQRLRKMLEAERPELVACGAYSGHEMEQYEQELLSLYSHLQSKLEPLVVDVEAMMQNLRHRQARILYEGAQGVMLDLRHGTYPFVTSCTTGAAGVYTGGGVEPGAPLRVIGVSKAYTTRVGAGPFPTELDGPLADELRSRGAEYGTTTGRPRRVGWLDLFALRYAVQVGGIKELAITKIDVLAGLSPLKVAVGYRSSAGELNSYPSTAEELEKVEPIWQEWEPVEELDPASWRKMQGKPMHQLPPGIRNYLSRIADYCECPVTLLSYGPKREDTLVF